MSHLLSFQLPSVLSEKSSYTEWKGLLISTCPLPAGRLKLEVRRVTSYYSHTGGIWGTCQKCSSSYSLIQSTAGQCYTKPGSDFLSTCPGNPHCQAGHSGDKKDFQSSYGSFLYHKGLTKLSPGDDWQPELIHVTKCTLGCDAEREYFQVLKRQLFQ